MPNHYTEADVALARQVVEMGDPVVDPELEPLVTEPAPAPAAPPTERRLTWEEQGYSGAFLDLMNKLRPEGGALIDAEPEPEPAAAAAAPPPEQEYAKTWEDRGFSGPVLDLLNTVRPQGPGAGAALVGPQDARDRRHAASAAAAAAAPAAAPGVIDQGVSLPGLTDTEQAAALDVADVTGEPPPTPPAPPPTPGPVTIEQANALYNLGVNATKQADQRKGIHDQEKIRLEAEHTARLAAETTKKTRMVEWNGKLARLEDELQHFGMDKDNMRAAQALLKRQPEANWTLGERENLIRQQAMAKAQLQSARTLNTMGPFRHMASKFLAALSVGAGSWAAVRTGRNPAMELYKSAIERDIAAQKGAYASKSSRLTRHINTYDRIQSEIGDDLTSTLLLAALQYGAGEQQALGVIEQLKGQEQKYRYQKLAADLRANKTKLLEEAQKAFLQKQLTVDRSRDIGILGVTYLGRKMPDGSYDTGMVPDKQEVKQIREAGIAYKQYMIRIAGLMQYAGKTSFIGDLDRKQRAGAAWEDIIALAAKLNKMGVLQKAERKNLEKVFTRPGGIKDNLGLLRPALEQLQSRAEGDWIGFMETKPHYKLDPNIGKKEWGIEARGQEN